MGLFYELSSIAFIGGSLVQIGGHNPLEAAHFGTAVLVGPDRRNNGAAGAALPPAGPGKAVGDAHNLGAARRRVLAAPSRGPAVARAARCVLPCNQSVPHR